MSFNGAGAAGGAASGAAMGTAVLPGIGTAVGAIAGGVLGGLGGGGAKKAKKAQEKRYRDMLALLAKQGQATKADIRAGAVEERAGQVQTAAGRGLYNTSVLDTLQGQSNDREARALANVDQSVAAGQVQVMNDRTDYASDDGTADAFKAIGAALPGILGGFGVGSKSAPGTNPQNIPTAGAPWTPQTTGGVTVGSPGGARSYSQRLMTQPPAPPAPRAPSTPGTTAFSPFARMPRRRPYASYAASL